MLTNNFQVELDSIWTAFWPATEIKPLSVVDFINCVLFIKQMDDDTTKSATVFTTEHQEFRWSAFQNLDKQSLYELFNNPDGLLNFVRTKVGYTPVKRLGKEPVPIIPTSDLLAKTVRHVNRLPSITDETRKDLVEYLFQKMEEPMKNFPAEKVVTPKKHIPNKRRIPIPVIALSLIVLAGLIALYANWKHNNETTPAIVANDTTYKVLQPIDTPVDQTVRKQKSKKPSKATKVVAVSGNEAKASLTITDTLKTSVEKKINRPSVTSTNLRDTLSVRSPSKSSKGHYKVISKAYFHDEPDEHTRRNAFVIHWNNSYATLNALDEKNGFIYVIFHNHLNQTSKGWLRKKDLRPVD